MIINRYSIFILFFFVTFAAFGAAASQALESSQRSQTGPVLDSHVQGIVDRVVKAYGGSQLTGAKSIKITDYNKGPWPGESENPGIPEIWRINEELTIDFENKRKSLLSYRVPRTTLDLEKWIFDGEKTIKYDLLHQKYAYENWATYDRLGGSIVRSSDTMYAYKLFNNLKSATDIGEEYYRGKLHQRLAVTLMSGSEFIYAIDKDSGLIRKVLREHPQAGKLVYIFSNHQQVNGVTYAKDMNFFVAGQLRLTSVMREIELDPPLKDAFKGFEDYTPWGEQIDSSKMTVKTIANGVYQAGKGRALSVFIEHPEYYIATGSASALLENFKEVKKLTLDDKPIKYYIVTHHHRGSLAGLNNVIAKGVKLIASKAHQASILASLATGAAESDLILVPDRKPFSIGKVTLYDIATAHSQHYLTTYLPSDKSMIADEHYETDLLSGKPRIYKDMVRFIEAVDSLNIDIKKLVDFRSWRAFDMAEFKLWTEGFTEKTCPEGYAICANG